MKLTNILASSLTACLLAWPLAASPITYTYTGNDFQAVSGSYATSDFVSGYFTLSAALPDSQALMTIAPLSYSFTDQLQTFSSTTPPPDVTFEVGTDASGQINTWNISLGNTLGPNLVTTISFSSDFGEMPSGAGSVLFDAGGWQMSGGRGSTVPEPGNIALIGAGVVAIALIRKNQRAHRA
jgi:hypothetical protein